MGRDHGLALRIGPQGELTAHRQPRQGCDIRIRRRAARQGEPLGDLGQKTLRLRHRFRGRLRVRPRSPGGLRAFRRALPRFARWARLKERVGALGQAIGVEQLAELVYATTEELRHRRVAATAEDSPQVVAAVKQCRENGSSFGAPTELEIT